MFNAFLIILTIVVILGVLAVFGMLLFGFVGLCLPWAPLWVHWAVTVLLGVLYVFHVAF